MLKSQFDWTKKDKVIKASYQKLDTPPHLPWNTNTLDLFLILTPSWWNLCVTDLFICHISVSCMKRDFLVHLMRNILFWLELHMGEELKITAESETNDLLPHSPVRHMFLEWSSRQLLRASMGFGRRENRFVFVVSVCVNSGDLFSVQVWNFLSPWCCDQECRWCNIKLTATYDTEQLLPAYHYNPPRYHGNQLFPSCERLVGAFREDGRAPVAGSPTLPGERSHFNFWITLPLRIADKSRLIARLSRVLPELCSLEIVPFLDEGVHSPSY